eukprot:2284170-Rhodomonas_salina.1
MSGTDLAHAPTRVRMVSSTEPAYAATHICCVMFGTALGYSEAEDEEKAAVSDVTAEDEEKAAVSDVTPLSCDVTALPYLIL